MPHVHNLPVRIKYRLILVLSLAGLLGLVVLSNEFTSQASRLLPSNSLGSDKITMDMQSQQVASTALLSANPLLDKISRSTEQSRPTAVLQSVQLGPSMDLGCVNPPYTTTNFFNNTVTFNYKGGSIILSSTPDGIGVLKTDDEVKIEVTRPDGSTALLSYVFGYPRNSQYVEPLPPQDVTDLFRLGINTISITYVDNSSCASSNAYYLKTDESVLLPHRSTGYRYEIIDQNAPLPSGFEQAGFDDSSWNIGDAPFGFSVGYCSLTRTFRTAWRLNSDLLVRRTLSIPNNTNNLRVAVSVDNDLIAVYFNGVQIAGPMSHAYDCPQSDDFTIQVPQNLVQLGNNIVAYRLHDYGGESFFDTQILGDTSSSCVPAQSGIVGWWPGDGNTNDIAGGDNGTLHNGATFAPGNVGQAFSFNGNSQYVSIPHSDSLNQFQETTVEAWVRPAEMPSGEWMSVVTKDNPDPGPYHLLVRQNGSVSWGVVTSAWVEINSGTDRISPGEFSHIAGTYNASTGAFCVYVNGHPTCTQLSGLMRTNSNAIKIGADLYNGLFFKGEIDEVGIYNRALSALEIQSIYNAGSAGKCRAQCTVPSVTSPKSQTVLIGQVSTLTVTATGTGPFSYQWYRGLSGNTSNPVNGATGNTFNTPALPGLSRNYYWVRVINGCFSVDSTAALVVTTDRRPLIFVPGIAGSRLDNTTTGENLWLGDIGTNHNQLNLFQDTGVIKATEVLRRDTIGGSNGYPTINYGPLLEMLTNNNRGGYREYQLSMQPGRVTSLGCDINNQINSSPTLFVFPYDWRKSNGEDSATVQDSAKKLADYIQCIDKFYPNTQVDILTHSMGGLVAQRYLSTTFPVRVNTFITIAAPWLGAPKAIGTLERGKFLDNFARPLLITDSTVKTIAESFPGVHQLLPSRKYFEIAGRLPFSYNNSLIQNYDVFVHLLDFRFPRSSPGSAGKRFHDRISQDDARCNPPQIRYFHLYGQRPTADTIGAVSVSSLTICGTVRGCKTQDDVSYAYVLGDRTVPVRSAIRKGGSPFVDLNEGGVTPRVFTSSDAEQVSHIGLTQFTPVHDYILGALGIGPPITFARNSKTEEPEVLPAYYLKLTGPATVNIGDANGNQTNPLSDPADAGLPGVSSYLSGDKSAIVVMPTDQTYTITFHTDDDPIEINLTKGTDTETMQAVRYKDLSLPANITAQLVITSQGIGDLRYDSNGDGTFETSVAPTVSVSGVVAQDTDSPSINVSEERQQNNTLVTITASDTGSGVQSVKYSLDGINFQSYTGILTLDACQSPVIYVFADDNVANRSALVTYYLKHSISGQITDANTNGIGGVTVTLSGAQTATTTTDSSGNYSFANVIGGDNYSVTPSLVGYTFSSSNKSFADLTCDQTANFTGSPAPSPTPVSARNVLISEFRLRGPNGANDEFVELYNNTDSNIVVGTTDGSNGWIIAAIDSSGESVTTAAIIPLGTLIPSRGHYLAANINQSGGPYSLSSYAASDLTYTKDIVDNTGIALFKTATPSNLVIENRLDAVGFSNGVGTMSDLYREGVGLSALGGTNVESSFVRKTSIITGLPQDTQDNAADFVIVATDGNATIPTAILGSPGPQNSTSPILRESTIRPSYIDPLACSSCSPNRVRVGSGNSGTLNIRRHLTNTSNATVTRLRFRIIDITTLGSPVVTPPQAQLSLADSTDATVGTTLGTVMVKGTTIEQPPSQIMGGGLNSSMNVSLLNGIAPGAGVDVQFLLNVIVIGRFRFYVSVEALP